MTDASATLLHAVYQYRTLLMRAYARGSALPERDRATLAGLERNLGVDVDPLDAWPRKHKRVAVNIAAELVDSNRTISARAVDLGGGGVRLDRAETLPAHRILTVRLDGPRDYRFPARLVWFTRRARGFSLGLMFVGAPVELRRAEYYERP